MAEPIIGWVRSSDSSETVTPAKTEAVGSVLAAPEKPKTATAALLGSTRLITIAQAQDVFARYLLDRADQYQTDSPCWIALADAAQELANGEAWSDFEHGELDGDDLKRRVKSMARTPGARSVDPKLGTDDQGGSDG